MLLTLCIPSVDTHYTPDYIYSILNRACIGKIHGIKEMVSHTKINSKKVFVTLNVYQENDEHRHLLERLGQGKNIKVMHEEPYYWKMVQCK
jgi:hypothetical protein